MRYLPVGVAHRLAKWITPVALVFAPGHFERAHANMRQILGPSADPRLARRLTIDSFVNYGRYMVDLLRLPNLPPHAILKSVQIEGWEHVEHAYAQGSGVVFITGHIGNWDLAAATFVQHGGRTVSALVETLKPERWNERVQAIRDRIGIQTIPIENGVRDMLGALRRKEGLAILVDRPVPDGVPVRFFGRETRVPGGAATLALRTGSPVVPAIVVRHPSGRGYLARIGEPFLTAGRGTSAVEVQALTQQIMGWLEDQIREFPDQWYMFRHMWPLAEPGPARTATPALRTSDTPAS